MKIKTYLSLCLSCTMLFACNEDNATPSDTNQPDGNAYLGLSISFSKNTLINFFSKATDTNDPTAESTEAKVSTIDVYIKAQTAGAKAKLIAQLDPATDFTFAGNKYTATKALKVKGIAGDKNNVYVVINSPESDLSEFVDGNIPYVKNAADFTVGDKFTMFNTSDNEVTLSGDSSKITPVTVNVERIVSKILVKTASGQDFSKTFADKNKTGLFDGTKLRWRVANSNKKVYTLPKELPGSELGFEDPNYIFTPGLPYSYYSGEYEQLSTADGEILPNMEPNIEIAPNTIGPTGFDADKGYVGYANENTNDSSVVANTTYILLSSVFTPSSIVTDVTGGSPGNPVVVQTKNSTAVTFYYHLKTGLYFTQTAFEKYMTGTVIANTKASDFSAGGKPYKEGTSYFFFNLKKGNYNTVKGKLGTLRNHFYTASVSNFIAPGSPINPTQIDPNNDKPAEASDVFIEVNITVDSWDGVDMGSIELK